jgi:hypothetical protein
MDGELEEFEAQSSSREHALCGGFVRCPEERIAWARKEMRVSNSPSTPPVHARRKKNKKCVCCLTGPCQRKVRQSHPATEYLLVVST